MRVVFLLTYFTSALATVFLLPIAGQSSERMLVRFEDLPNLVRAANGHVQAADQEARAAEKRTGYLLRSYLPTLRASGGREKFQTGPFSAQSQPYGSIEATINLFRGGRDALEGNVRGGLHAQAESESQQTFFSELSEARHAFWQLVYRREVIKLLRTALEQNKKNMTAALKRIKGGLATNTDKLEFEIAKIQFDQDISRLELESVNAQRRLAALFGRPVDTQIDTEELVPHEHDDSIFKETFSADQHRDVRAFMAGQSVFEAQKSQAYRWWAPSLDVYGSYSLYTLRDRDFIAMRDRYESVLGIRLTFELFDGLQSNTEGSAASLQAQAAETRAAQSARELTASFENAKQELALIHKLIHEGERNVEKGREYLNSTLSEYSRGVKNSPDVLSATEKYVEFKRRYAELRRDYQIARSELMALLEK